MKITFSESAIQDMESIQNYYAEQLAPEVGDKLIGKIITQIETLQSHPEIGRIVPELEIKSIRELIHPPYRVIYVLENRMIRVIRVWRSERLLQLSQTEV